MSLNTSCIDLTLLGTVVKSQILSLLSDNTLQAGLSDCSGSELGKARVPSCDAMDNAITAAVTAATTAITTSLADGVKVFHDKTLVGDGTKADPLSLNLCGLLETVVHDSTLSGYGTCQSPLTVNTSWLQAFVQNLADTLQLVHVGSGGGIAGSGTLADPFTLNIQHDTSLDGKGTTASLLSLAIQHDTSLDGKGTTASPLAVDETWLNNQIEAWVSGHGVSTAEGGGIAGNGSSNQPLSLAINHDNSLDGDGTSAKPLTVDAGWLKGQIDDEVAGSVLAPAAGAAPAAVTQTDSVATTIVGGTSETMGAPDAYAKIGGYLVPLYKAAA